MDNLLSAEQIKLEAVGSDDVAQRFQIINGRLISVDSDTNNLLESFTTDADLGLSSQQDVLNSVYSDVHGEVSSVLDEEPPTIDPDQVLVQLMDIRTSLLKLRAMLEQRTGVNLSAYEFWLQDSKQLDIGKTLVDQCINREGPVQVNIQIRPIQKRINIVDVLKPDEEFVDMDNNTNFELGMIENEDVASPENETDPLQLIKPDCSVPEQVNEEVTQNSEEVPLAACAKWVIDYNFKADQLRLQIPEDPKLWTVIHVRHWIQWAVRQFKLIGIKLVDWSITGKELCAMSLEDFKKKCPSDPGDLFWTHLELLKKCSVVATHHLVPSAQVEEDTINTTESRSESLAAIKKKQKFSSPTGGKSSGSQPITLMTAGINRSGNNGQIQLWQFLLELLTSMEHTSVIQWIGTSGEFKLQEPAVVARLWGKRKHKPTMNYEKLSRALRYYYDGDMISKVHGKRFVYRFVCDLKQLIGYDAGELARLVNGGSVPEQSESQNTSWQMH